MKRSHFVPPWSPRCRPFQRTLFACAWFLALVTMDRPADGAVTTLEQLLGGGTLDAGGVQFSDWQLVSLDDTTLPLPDFTQVAVAALEDDPLNPGLQWTANGQFFTASLNSIDLLVKFVASPHPGANPIAGHALDLTSFEFGGASGIALVSAEAADAMGGDLGPALVIADKQSNFFQLHGDAAFAPQSSVSVTLNLFVTGLAEADTVSVNGFTQRFSQVPEPSGILLALASIALLACLRRA